MLKVRKTLMSCISAKDKHTSTAPALVFTKVPHHLLLPLVISGNDVMRLVGALGTCRADADVVGAAVDVQQTLVFLADLVLQVESRFNQSVGCHGLHLLRRKDNHNIKQGREEDHMKYFNTKMSDSEGEVFQIYKYTEHNLWFSAVGVSGHTYTHRMKL